MFRSDTTLAVHLALNVKNQRIGSIGCRLIILSPPRPRALVAVLVYLTEKRKIKKKCEKMEHRYAEHVRFEIHDAPKKNIES